MSRYSSLLPALVGLFLIASSGLFAADPVGDGLAEEWGTSNYQRVALTLPAEADHVSVSVMIDGSARQIDLQRHSLRAPGLQATVYSEKNGQPHYEQVPLGRVRTYRGSVASWSDATVVASFGRYGLTAAIYRSDTLGISGDTWRIEPARRYDASAPLADHVVFQPRAVPIECGVAAGAVPVTTSGAQPFGGVPPTLCGMTLAEIAFDCDFEYYTQQGGTVLATTDRVEAILNDVDYFYKRDMMVEYLLTAVVVRTAQFYADISGGDLLTQFRDEWNTNQTATVRDITHLMTNKSNLSGYAGLAYVGVVCTGSQYGWSVDSAGVVGHEVGHNWGSGHCHDTNPCNNMCGACLSIGPNTLDIKRAHMATRTCLDPLPPTTDPLPPYAKIDELTLTEVEMLSGTGFVLDVLDNDHDANCDPILVSSVDATSVKGGTVTLSAGTGTGGFDQVVYTPPLTGFSGDDRFDYTISDGAMTTTTRVEITVQRDELVAYFPLDETTGTTAFNQVPSGGTGAVNGTDFATTSETAIYTTGLRLDGVDDFIESAALNTPTRRLTITAWIKRSGAQTGYAGLVFCRGGDTTSGLNFGTANELRYHWDSNFWSWNSGLVVPDDQWTFVALAIRPGSARMYMQTGLTAPLQVAVNSGTHFEESFNAALHIGQDPTGGRLFAGVMDDVRVYSYALTTEEIADIAAGGVADLPAPPRYNNDAPQHPVLSWNPGITAVEHDVYFGTDEAAVAVATPTSPEYRGRHDATALHPLPMLPPQSTQTWLIDSVLADGTVLPGRPWTFTTGSKSFTDDLVVHYTFNNADVTGTTILDQSPPPTFDGQLMNGPTVTAGQVRQAHYFDGVDDFVEAGSLNLNSNTVTISAWVKRDGPQTGTNGIVFWRGGTTGSAFNLGSHHELRYHWNGAEWWWDSGLEIPDNEWCHVALVIEPNQATLYRNGDSVVRGATHDAEAFDTPMVVGKDPGFTNRDFKGSIDELAIWSRSLSPAEVLTLYAAGRLERPIQGDSDVQPPTPDPLTWELEPVALGTDAIEMQVVTATDPSAVEYFFDCTSGPGNDSGWQQSPYYVDTGLSGGGPYTYVAMARDVSPNLNVGGATGPKSVSLGTQFIRGDTNGDNAVNVADAVATLAYLFNSGAITCFAALDANDNGGVDIADAVFQLSYLFSGGATIPAPFPACGSDATGAPLGCVSYSCP